MVKMIGPRVNLYSAKFYLLQKLKIIELNLFSLSDSLFRSMCALLRFYLGP